MTRQNEMLATETLESQIALTAFTLALAQELGINPAELEIEISYLEY